MGFCSFGILLLKRIRWQDNRGHQRAVGHSAMRPLRQSGKKEEQFVDKTRTCSGWTPATCGCTETPTGPPTNMDGKLTTCSPSLGEAQTTLVIFSPCTGGTIGARGTIFPIGVARF